MSVDPLRIGYEAARLWFRIATLPLRIASGLLSHGEEASSTAAEPAIKLDVPLDVEVGWGAHWGEAH